MRISDWSSDVCSSDLRPALGDPDDGLHARKLEGWRQLPLLPRVRDARNRMGRVRFLAAAVRLHALWRKRPGRARHEADRALLSGQLGSTSCRERVGQYGALSVVAGSLKKKTRR